MASLKLSNIYKVYDGGVRAVSDFNLEIEDKEFVIFVGPSGCGKSTTLRMIAGLEEITSGELELNGVRVNEVQPKDRNIAMVFQNYALYPHMTVYQNMAFGLRLRKLPSQEIAERVNRAADILGITDLLNRKPKALSGGQRQRVALGRAIVREPNVFLLDEPLSNLDAKLRVQMRTEITKLHNRLATTFIYVTHDQTEAMTMGDRIVVMKDGLIQQADTPSILFEQPANVFVATFLGSPQMNIISGTLALQNDTLTFEFGDNHQIDFIDYKRKQLSSDSYIGGPVQFGIRPEHITISDTGVDASIDVVEHLGSETIVYVSVSGVEGNIVLKKDLDHSLKMGQKIKLSFDTGKAHVFDSQTGLSIMGIPTENVFPCKLDGENALLGSERWELPEKIKKHLPEFAERDCIHMSVRTEKISEVEIPDALPIQAKVAFTVVGSETVSVYTTTEDKPGYFVYRSHNFDIQAGDDVTLWIPYKAISFLDSNHMRLNTREEYHANLASCKLSTKNGISTISIGGKKLTFEDLGKPDGEYQFHLFSDKVGYRYTRNYLSKFKDDPQVKGIAKPSQKDKINTLWAQAYDEERVGGEKNVVYVKIRGFDDYLTLFLPDEFSVYKMPNFPIAISKDSFELL